MIYAASAALLLLARVAASAAAVERLVGRARTVDGDTLDVGGVRVRLLGVAALTPAQLLGTSLCRFRRRSTQ